MDQKMIMLRTLYSLRDVTGFCSELAMRAFVTAITNESKPLADTRVSRALVASHPIGREALVMLALPLGDSIDVIMKYTQPDTGTETPGVDLAGSEHAQFRSR